jgi:ribosomal protein L11 methyltransferase
LIRLAVRVARAQAELVLAELLELAPGGVEEVELGEQTEYAVYGAPGELPTLPALRAAAGDALVEIDTREIPDDWEERWREFHRPVRIGSLWIGPPWETPPPDAIAVVVDPGPAFGTGAHPTTRLAVELLTTLPTGSLLDVGCGSGVIAIAGAKLGFAPVAAVDVEPQAVSETTRNAKANGVSVAARCVDALATELAPADVAVANITLAAVRAVAERVAADRLVTSGYLVSDEPDLPGWERLERRERDGWAADVHRPAVRR